jgi:hypothetical protein
MAKRRKTLPARKPRDRDDDSLLLRSAESLGRVIGALQRQLDAATKRLSPANGDARKLKTVARSRKTAKTATAKKKKKATKTKTTRR